MLSRSASLRALIRLDNWWEYKIPPLLSAAAAVLLVAGEQADRAVLLVAAVWSISAVAAYGYVVNDVFDIEADARVGKPNAVAGLRPLSRLVAALLAAGLAFAPAVFVDYPRVGLLLLVANILLPTLYSLPIVRLKERGLLGVLADAAGAHVVPTLFVIAVFGQGTTGGWVENAAVLAGLVACATVLGAKGILRHQLVDREGDLDARVSTFLTRHDSARVSRLLTAVSLGVELPVATALALLLLGEGPLALAALVFYVALESAKWRLGWRTTLGVGGSGTLPNVPFANNYFYEVWLPAALSLELALRYPELAWLPIGLPILFRRNYWSALRETGVLAEILATRIGARYGRMRASS